MLAVYSEVKCKILEKCAEIKTWPGPKSRLVGAQAVKI